MKRLGALILPGWDASPSQGTQHEATKSITTPLWMAASPSQGTQHEKTRSINTPLDGVFVHHMAPSMKRLGVLLLPPRWEASPSQGTQHEKTRGITTPSWMGG